MNFAIIIGLVVFIGLKTLHGTDVNDDTSDRRLLEKSGENNARKMRLPLIPRMRLYRRKMKARRRGYFRDTTQRQFQSYDSWGAGGQLDLLLEQYGEGPEREEEELPQEPVDYLQALRARVHLDGHNRAEREHLHNKMLMKSQNYAKKAKPENLLEAYKYKGDWVYGRNVSIYPSEVFGLPTTNRTPAYYNDRSCLRPCPLIYKFDYGQICAIRWHRPPPEKIRGWPYPTFLIWFEKELGTTLYPTYFLKNFTNLCEMEVHNCIMLQLNSPYVHSWKVMFRGKCPPGMDDEKQILADNGPPGNPEPLTDAEKEIKLAEELIKVAEENHKKISKKNGKSMKDLLEQARNESAAQNPNKP